ncbi:MAG: lytic transglycosylase domain-containing protein, partial [Pseudomonadota bacterium]
MAALAKGTRICRLIEDAAEEFGLNPHFFARLIWKESRFDAKALSPKGAQGIAQFMPGTAKLVGLKDPWDPARAIPASASHLADLHRAFGNWGLAAAGYNAGAGRVERFKRNGRLPGEPPRDTPARPRADETPGGARAHGELLLSLYKNQFFLY